jgi:hypothetical protein
MKKIILVILLLCSVNFLFSCKKKAILDPDEISVNGKTIQYSYEKDQVEKKLGQGDNADDFPGRYDADEYDGDLILAYNDNDEIRCMVVEDDSINTFRDVRVGDDIDDVLDKFKYKRGNPRSYSVYFKGTEELDPADAEALKRNYIIITYSVDDDKVEKIYIMDREYAIYLK